MDKLFHGYFFISIELAPAYAILKGFIRHFGHLVNVRSEGFDFYLFPNFHITTDISLSKYAYENMDKNKDGISLNFLKYNIFRKNYNIEH